MKELDINDEMLFKQQHLEDENRALKKEMRQTEQLAGGIAAFSIFLIGLLIGYMIGDF